MYHSFNNVSPVFSVQAAALSTLRRNAFNAYFTFLWHFIQWPQKLTLHFLSAVIYHNVGSFSIKRQQ